MSEQLPAAASAAETVLLRACRRGRLRRVPKKPFDRLVLLALAAKTLERQYPYSEPEMNAALEDWLDGVRGEMDHVTLRRYLVDFGLIKRDTAGRRYFLNTGKLREILAVDALELDSRVVIDSVAQDEWARRRAWQRAQEDPSAGAPEGN